MRYVRWIFLVVTIAAVWACTPFVGMKADGGGGGSGNLGGATAGASGVGAQAGAASGAGYVGSAGVAGAVDSPSAAGSTQDAGTDATGDTPLAAADEANGAVCKFDTDCHFGHCVEGVCCESACTGKCASCLASHTGKPDGRCAPVEAGLPHGGDCASSAASTCGLDGKCDGAGACELYAQGTICGGESCPSGTSDHTPMRMCDGNGACASVKGSCGNYLCSSNGVSCRANCSADADCSSGGYCDASTCKAKLNPGALCGRDQQCSSGLCGGRCCNPGTPCACHEPSPENLLANAGFDKDLSGWESLLDQTWSSQDVEGCPFSGSAHSATATGYPKQCVRISPGIKYSAGASDFVVGDGVATCEVTFFADNACAGNATAMTTIFGPDAAPGKWAHYVVEIDATSTSHSALVDCDVASAFVDQIFLTPIPGGF